MSSEGDEDTIVCLPGERLCRIEDNVVLGIGTYEQNGYIYASKSGVVNIEESGENCQVVSVHKPGFHLTIPATGDVVTARVLVTTPKFAKCAIFCVRNVLLESSYRGLLRKEDVRETEKDRVDIYKSFKPGDVILARVINQMEQSFLLTTAETELGVVVAYASDARKTRVPMVPVGWSEMQCPLTTIKEPRKVAKVLPESTINTINAQ
ncbi:exosome complex component CSL4 [Drosophila madeirensis]|uniref:Blast:Exosome complex component CSL4 n=2 Tax=obscura subgroup TaxID=32357 RepID=A0A3B0JAW1_DROGU|nr:exosome complex component CSL4 [Drosophila guanche]SPP79477.1 blast:Exosome complex component CSL4 [Drosophila guanche]